MLHQSTILVLIISYVVDEESFLTRMFTKIYNAQIVSIAW